MAGRLAVLLLTVLTAATRPAWAADAAAVERAFFRTVTLNYASAPKETVAAAARCMTGAVSRASDGFKTALVEIDRRPVYRGSDRMRAISEAIVIRDAALTGPLRVCFDKLADGGFGATTGAIPATAAANPGNVPPCPISVTDVSADALTCYCQPMLGGIAYGHKTYADTSSICLAARHAGAMDYLTAGVIKAAFKPGCAAYEGVEANGTLSAQAGASPRSFHFPSVGEGKCPK